MAGAPKNIFGKKVANVTLDERLAGWAIAKDGLGVDWTLVGATTLRASIALCLSNGFHLTFSPAAGGLGVCLKLWNGGADKKEYAMNAEQTELLLDGLIDALASGSEDARIAYSGGKP